MKHEIDAINIDVHVKENGSNFFFVHIFREGSQRQVKGYSLISQASYDRLCNVLKFRESSSAAICGNMISLWYRK
jgi:hypothetical protein